MKFGRTITQAVLSEPDQSSRDAFVSYKLLKKQFSLAPCPAPNRRFERLLKHEVEKFSGWFAREVLLLSADFWRVERHPHHAALSRLGPGIRSASHGVFKKDKELIARAQRIRRFAQLNTLATWKILKKYAKRCGPSALGATSLDAAFRKVLAESPVVSASFWKVVDDLCTRAVELDSSTHLGPLAALEPPDAYACPICLEMLLHPVVARQCGHRFCSSCIQIVISLDHRSTNQKGKCPVCRLPGIGMHLVKMQALDSFLRHNYPVHWRQRLIEAARIDAERRKIPRSHNAMLRMAD